MIDHYEILGCTKDSTYQEIKQAYHSLALQYHPDKCSEYNAEYFQHIQDAWKILGDSKLRQEYDIMCKQEELDAECVLVYARISVDELEESEYRGELIYRCRCGGVYRIEEEALKEKNRTIQIPCQECTFSVFVNT